MRKIPRKDPNPTDINGENGAICPCWHETAGVVGGKTLENSSDTNRGFEQFNPQVAGRWIRARRILIGKTARSVPFGMQREGWLAARFRKIPRIPMGDSNYLTLRKGGRWIRTRRILIEKTARSVPFLYEKRHPKRTKTALPSDENYPKFHSFARILIGVA